MATIDFSEIGTKLIHNSIEKRVIVPSCATLFLGPIIDVHKIIISNPFFVVDH